MKKSFLYCRIGFRQEMQTCTMLRTMVRSPSPDIVAELRAWKGD
jgi:hypothetical protein